MESGKRKHGGGCHCGAVRFEVAIDPSTGDRCNCSVCNKLGATTSIVRPGEFTLLSGEEALTAYEWGMRTAKRFFCSRCGITCFLRGTLPQLGGEYVSVAVNCLDDVDLTEVTIQHWDGRHNNWEAGTRSSPWPIRGEKRAPA